MKPEYQFPKNYLSKKKKRGIPVKIATDSKNKSVKSLTSSKGGGSHYVTAAQIK